MGFPASAAALERRIAGFGRVELSVGADWDMTIRDRAQIELRRLPLLRHANRGLALDRFADLTHGGDVAFKGGVKRPQCDGIAIGCT